ncbi:MAG: ABC transporter ATP-binding protein [Prolixibacteraceae bacterium]|nr:ABC transporter ATP-binding protein [Prolixibacteraceae bacterium]
MRKVIEISGLTKRYGNHTVVNNLNLSVGEGEIFGLLGPNGAGKSTTILMLMGLTEPDEGNAVVCGLNPTRNPIRVKRKVGYLPEDVGFYDDFTGLENLVYTARLNNIPKAKAEENAVQLLKRVNLLNEKDKKAGKYSRGMRQRLGLADVLIKNPEVIILDEPTLGIDPSGIKDFLDLIVHLSRQEGITVLFSSHNLYQVQKVCDRVGIFVDGKLLAEGDIHSLAKKLFSSHLYSIEGEIAFTGDFQNNTNGNQISVDRINEKLSTLEGVEKVMIEENYFYIESEHDIASQISRLIVNEGFGLHYLTRKEYGLDDIYHEYFQGGKKL